MLVHLTQTRSVGAVSEKLGLRNTGIIKVLVFHYCHYNDHKLIFSQFYGSEVWYRSHWANIKVSTGHHFLLEALGRLHFAHSGWCQNSVPCGCRLRFLFPCWLSAEGCFQLLETTHVPWLVTPLPIFKVPMMDGVPLFQFLLSITHWLPLLLLRAHVIILGQSGYSRLLSLF